MKFLDKLETKNPAHVHQIFSSTEIILYNMKYSKKSLDNTLKEFIDRLPNKNSLSQHFRESPLKDIELRSIIDIYQELEERLFKYIWNISALNIGCLF